MKRKLVFIVTLIMILSIFVSCNEADQNGDTVSKATSTDNSDSGVIGTDTPDACRSPEYTADDLDVFIDEWVQAQLNAGENQVNNSDADPISIVVPTLQSNEYRFMHMFVDEYNYQYFYVPLDYSDRYFNSDVGIQVFVSRTEGSFEAVMEQLDLTPTNGVAYESSYNIWIIDSNGKRISIRLPETIQLADASEIDNYFTFETYGGSGNDGTVTE